MLEQKGQLIFCFRDIATFTNLPEFINDIKNEYKK